MSQRAKLMALPLNVLDDFVREAIDILKERRRIEARKMAWSLNVGETVQFTQPRTGTVIVGKIKEIKQTKALVFTGAMTWNVPMSMLKVVPSADKPSPPPGVALF